MPVFKNSEMTMFSSEGEWTHPCEVKITDASIVVSYRDDGQFVVYEGEESGEGHFKLRSSNVKGRGTLHRFPNDDIFEGWWAEESYQGMWRIQLDE